MNAIIEEKWKRWREQRLEDPDLKQEMQEMQNDDRKITECFYKELEFGTGGMRGIIGAGTNRINIYTVAKATQGYTNYLKNREKQPSVAIAYDSRIKSRLFAEVAAELFAANGVRVHIYRGLMPTPMLSFAIRCLGCSGGIVITASHNPAKYNGYKVYGSDGCQITTQAAQDIFEEIQKVDLFSSVKKGSFEEEIEKGRISFIGEETVNAYMDAVSAQALCRREEIDRDVSIVYTPLNGAGLKPVLRCLRENGFSNIFVVPEQEQPDGNFPTCPYPNPEVKEALELGIRDARRLESDLVIATDPDCDRVGIAVRDKEDYVLLSANEVGLLLLEYICSRRLELHKMPPNPVMMKTIVTTDMAARIAAYYGVQVIDVLTGFKFIGEQIGFLERKGEEERFILGFEESYGYLTGTYVRDKDGVNAALMICEMFAYYKTQGKALIDVLNGLYEKFGYCLNTLHTYRFEGIEGTARMQEIMEDFRKHAPGEWAGHQILSVSDYRESVTHYRNGNDKILQFPKSNVLKYMLEGDISVVVRPSGTEPKLKMYYSVRGETMSKAEAVEKLLAEEIERERILNR